MPANTIRPLSLAVLHGGPSSEHDISVITAREVLAALRGGGHSANAVYVDRGGRWHFGGVDGAAGHVQGHGVGVAAALTLLADLALDCAFLGFHGTYGEDGRIQAVLDLAGVPFTGSRVLASALAMDKPLARRVLRDAGMTVARAIELRTDTLVDMDAGRVAAAAVISELGLPVVVKVPAGGSSVGIEIPRDADALLDTLVRLSPDAELLLCEEFVTGVELTAGVLATTDGGLQALPIVEIAPKGDRFFDYEAKYDPALTDEIVPARIPAEIEQRARKIGLLAHRVLGCHGVSRTDLIWDGGERLVVLETNTLPGLTPASLLPKAAAAVGCDYLGLLLRIIHASVVAATPSTSQ